MLDETDLSDVHIKIPPVFAADIKGDLSGMSEPGVEDDKIKARASSVGQAWEGKGFPVTYYTLGGQARTSRCG